MPTGSEIERRQLAGKPNGWYVFNRAGRLLSGPWEEEDDADGDRLDKGDWIGELDDGILDISYAPENIT